MKRQSYRAALNRAVHHAAKVQWHDNHLAAMARARAFIASNPQPRATFDCPR